MRRHKGFTLVELVVVVMILGILAAVAAPKLLGTSAAASENGLKQTLAVVRDAVERFAAENGGKLPGTGDTTGADLVNDLTPFLRGGFPKCPVGKKDATIKVTAAEQDITGEDPPTKAWHYCSATGQFICNSSEETSSGDPASYDLL